MGWLTSLRALAAPRSTRAELGRLRASERAIRRSLGSLPRAERRRLRALACELVPLRERIFALTAEPRCCSRCAAPTPWGGEAHPGGLCCSGASEAIFTPAELAPLVLAGRAPSDRAAAAPRAGCLFRAAAGCLLPAGSRPSLCLGHFCRELAAELHGRGVIPELLALADELAAKTRAIGEALGLEADELAAKTRAIGEALGLEAEAGRGAVEEPATELSAGAGPRSRARRGT